MANRKSVGADLKLLDPFWRESVTRSVLSNGSVVVVKPDHSAALASVQVWIRSGSIHEGALLGSGVSHYLEHMLFKGTAKRSAREISAEVQAHGGYVNAYTTYDRTVYHIDLPSEHVGVAVDILSDMVLKPTLDPQEAAREKDVILREIAMTRDDPDHRLWEGLFSTSFREHPYRFPIIGHQEVFSALSAQDLKGYHRSRYTPENTTVIVVGDVDPAQVVDLVSKSFGQAERGASAPVTVPEEPPQLGPRQSHRTEDLEVTRGVVSWPIPGLSHEDSPVLDMLAMILGQGESSLLWREVREKAGLVHTIDAAAWNPGTTGLFCVSYTCEPAKRPAAEKAIESVLKSGFSKGFTPSVIAKALRQMVVGEINSRKTMGGQASRLGSAEVVVGDLGFARSYFERLAKASNAELRRAIGQYLIDSRRTAVSIGPKGAPAESLAPASRASAIEDFSQVDLANGARILLQRDKRLPSVHFRILFQGGPLYETPGGRGSTALLATLMAKDTRSRAAGEVARYIEEVGGSFFAVSGNNSLGLAAEVLAPDADRALSVLSGAVLEPAFKPSTFAIERDAQLAALRQENDDVVSFARRRLRALFFGTHPMALGPAGDEAGVQALKPSDLAALHKRLCIGPNTVLAVAGDFDPKTLLPKLRTFLSKLPKSRAPAPAPGPWKLGAAGEFSEKRDREQAVVLQAFPAPKLHTPDHWVSEVADELFSGMASRLFERVREEKGLAYFVRSTRVIGLDAGLFAFFAGTQPGKENEVLAEIGLEIERVASGGVEPAELKRCQVRLATARREQLQTNGSRAGQAALDALQNRPLNDWRQYESRIQSVTIEDLARFARTYLRGQDRIQLVVRP